MMISWRRAIELTVLVVLMLSPLPSRGATFAANNNSSLRLAPLLNDINILILTDTHSWIAGHRSHESHHDADYGTVLSFHSHMKALADDNDDHSQDVWFVMNGDFMHGTGLSTDPPHYILPLLEQMPWDVLNIGNHELYDNSTIEYISQKDGFVDYWDGRYLTSNTVFANAHDATTSSSSVGSRYRFLQGKEYTLLSFGFLYNLQNPCPLAHVETIQEVVNATWFQQVLRGDEGSFDAILILAHMDANDPLLTVLLDTIRSICGQSMTVQFVTGHSHERNYVQLDEYSTSLEAGRYLDTLGFVSFSLPSSHNDSHQYQQEHQPKFTHLFIDTSISVMAHTLDLDSDALDTPEGKALSSSIQSQRQALGLTQVLGCSPQTYNLSLGIHEPNSLWGLFANVVIHSELLDKKDGDGNDNENDEESMVSVKNRLYIQNPGAFRYDLYEGIVFLDDIVGVNPFNDSIFLMAEKVTGAEFLQAFGQHRQDSSHKFLNLTEYVISAKEPIQESSVYQVFAAEFDVSYVQEQLELVMGRSLSPEVQNETTGVYWTNYIERNWPCTLTPQDIDLFGGGGGGGAGKPFHLEWLKFVTMIMVVSFISFTMWFVVYRSEYGYSLRSGYPEEDYFSGFGISSVQRTSNSIDTTEPSLKNGDNSEDANSTGFAAPTSWGMVVTSIHDIGSVDGEESTIECNNVSTNKEVNPGPSSSLSPSELI